MTPVKAQLSVVPQREDAPDRAGRRAIEVSDLREGRVREDDARVVFWRGERPESD